MELADAKTGFPKMHHCVGFWKIRVLYTVTL